MDECIVWEFVNHSPVFVWAKLRLTPKIRVNHSSYSAQLGQRIEGDHHLGRVGAEHAHEITRLHVSSMKQGS